MLKKLIAFLIVLVFIVSACGTNETSKEKETEKETENGKVEKAESQSVNVDKGLINVEVTLPATFFEDQDINEVIASAKEEGFDEATANEDGSVTYKMSKAKHKEMMDEIKTGILETVEETKNSEDYVSIKDITHNDTFSEFTLVVDKAAYENSFDGFAAFGLGMSGAYYQIFNGVSTEDYKVQISIKDEASGEVFDTIVYPDALEELEAE
ncbi:hypothetical protein [Bacillus sp. FJAT-22090]|uniref:hypothetical protein n=1 Tax=Bacillus sp. FJAT-22090 TaxID=1581038 RepID=UPI0006AEC7D8|nr:hypothetical protein [Bacillus sp. FJAT-22090]